MQILKHRKRNRVKLSIKHLKLSIMPNTKKGTSADRKRVNSSEDYEVKHIAEKLGVSSQAIGGAKRATGSNDRKVIEDYIKNKKKTA